MIENDWFLGEVFSGFELSSSYQFGMFGWESSGEDSFYLGYCFVVIYGILSVFVFVY